MRLVYFLTVLMLVSACGGDLSQKQEARKPLGATPDPVNAAEEPFDLKVKKYEDPTRQSWQDPQLVLDGLGDLDGMVIADIGSGTGYFTFQLAGEAKKVIAIDVEKRFLDYIEDRKFELSNTTLANKIETRLIAPDNPSLSAEEVDKVLIVNSFTYIENRPEYLAKLRAGMKNGGQLLIVDYRQGDIPVGPANSQKVSASQVMQELRTASFKNVRVDSVSLQYQYMITSTK
jgi:ubiquinone/menaquinone biosynthesis C-methylase UbiE